MHFKTKDEAITFLEKQYPNHDFNWQDKGRRVWGLCPAHEDRHIGNFGVYFDKKANGWGFHCFACGFNHYQFRQLSPFQQDIEIFVNDLKDQIESESQAGYRYLAKRIQVLDYYKDLLFKQFEIGYHFYSRKFADEFSQEFRDRIGKIDDLWEPSGKDDNYNFEWLVFIYRSLHGKATSLKFRNITLKKDSLAWKDHGVKTVKLADETGIFGYKNLFLKAPVLFIVEGELDAITTTLLTELKYPAVAVSGTGGFNKSTIMKILSHKAVQNKIIVIQPDWDERGESALSNLITELPESILKKYKLYTLPKPDEDVKDLDEYLRDDPDDAIERIEYLFENAVSLYELKEKEKDKRKKEQEEKLKEYPSVVQSSINNNHVNVDEEFEDVCLSSLDEQIEEKEYILRGLRRGELCFLIARGGTGKSFLSIYFSIILSSSLTELEDVFISRRENAKRVLYLNLEDPTDIFKKRQKAIINKIAQTLQYKYTPDEIFNSCKNNLIVKRPKKFFELFTDNRGELVVNKENFEKLNILIKKYDPTLLIIDTFSKVSFIQESSNHLISEALARMQYFAETNNIAILILHHTSKFANLNNIASADAVRGATALYNNVRYVLQMQKVPVNTQKIKEIEKNFNSKDLMKHIENLSEDTRKRSVIVYESKNNFSKQVAYVYEKDKDGALYLTHSEPFEIEV